MRHLSGFESLIGFAQARRSAVLCIMNVSRFTVIMALTMDGWIMLYEEETGRIQYLICRAIKRARLRKQN